VKVYPCTLSGRFDIREDGSAVLYVHAPRGKNGIGLQTVRIIESDKVSEFVDVLQIDLEKPLRKYL